MNIQFNKNEDENKQLVFKLNERLKKVKLGGGEKKIESHHKKGKLTARERIDYLLDDPADFLEIGAFAAEGMYQEVVDRPKPETQSWLEASVWRGTDDPVG